jgi:hypothetical protein
MERSRGPMERSPECNPSRVRAQGLRRRGCDLRHAPTPPRQHAPQRGWPSVRSEVFRRNLRWHRRCTAPRRPDSQQTTGSRGHVLAETEPNAGCPGRYSKTRADRRGAAGGRGPSRGRHAAPRPVPLMVLVGIGVLLTGAAWQSRFVERMLENRRCCLSISAPAWRSLPGPSLPGPLPPQSAFSTSCAPTAAKSSRMAASRTLVLQWLWGTSEDQRTRLFR